MKKIDYLIILFLYLFLYLFIGYLINNHINYYLNNNIIKNNIFIKNITYYQNNSYNYVYRIIINLSNAEIKDYKLQPIILNISNFKGLNKKALLVLYNNSGKWDIINWEWFHQRGDFNNYANKTIRFLINCKNNSIQDNYFIFISNNLSYLSNNITIFQHYDGFEVGNTKNWINEGNANLKITNQLSANGLYCGNKTDSSNHDESYYNFTFEIDNQVNVTICWFIYWKSNYIFNAPSIAFMLQNYAGKYGEKLDIKLETWISTRYNSTIKLYDNKFPVEQIIKNFSFNKWEVWCYKNIDLRKKYVNANFYINGNLFYKNASGWDIHSDLCNTLRFLCPKAWIDKIDSFSIATANNIYSETIEIFIDEIYISFNYDYNIYKVEPNISVILLNNYDISFSIKSS